MRVDRLLGQATVSGTQRSAELFEIGARRLGRTGLHVAPIAVSCVHLHVDDPLSRRTLAEALNLGMNLIECGRGPTHRSSEALVGTVLPALVQSGEIERGAVVVASTVVLRDSRTPASIEDQVEATLARMELGTLDLVLIELDAADDAAMAGLKAAFTSCERLIEAGKLQWYGVISELFAGGEGDILIDTLVSLASEAGGSEHHLAAVQLPLNLLETAAVRATAREQSCAEVAARHNLAVLSHRPINAIVRAGDDSKIVHLADRGGRAERSSPDVQRTLRTVRELEARWAGGLGRQLVTHDGKDNAVDLFCWGRELATALPQIADFPRWMHLRHQVIAPHLGETSKALLASLDGDLREQFAAFWRTYGTALADAFAAIEADLRGRERTAASRVSERLDACLPVAYRDLPLAVKAVLAVLSEPSVSTVVVGVRRPRQVHDFLSLRAVDAAQALDLDAISAAVGSP